MQWWLQTELESRSNKQGQLGQYSQHSTNAQYTMRFLGKQSASGRRQVIITMWDQPSCALVFSIVYQWWAPVPWNVDSRGWRMCQCRWFT